MARDHHHTDARSLAIGDATHTEPLPARRDFLKRCGRYAAATPPLVTLLLSTAGPNYAVAASGRRRDESAPGAGDDPGSVAARIIARLPPQSPIQPVEVHRMSPIGAGNTVVRTARRTVCRGF